MPLRSAVLNPWRSRLSGDERVDQPAAEDGLLHLRLNHPDRSRPGLDSLRLNEPSLERRALVLLEAIPMEESRSRFEEGLASAAQHAPGPGLHPRGELRQVLRTHRDVATGATSRTQPLDRHPQPADQARAIAEPALNHMFGLFREAIVRAKLE